MRKNPWIRGILISALVVGWVTVLIAQQPAAPPPAKDTPTETPTPPEEAVVSPDPNFHYREGRDPFENLTVSRERKARPKVARSVADLLVEEVVILGIFRRSGEYYALVRGGGLPQAETIRKGQKLYNGEVLTIGPAVDEATGQKRLCVTFRVETDDPIRPYIRVVKCVAGT